MHKDFQVQSPYLPFMCLIVRNYVLKPFSYKANQGQIVFFLPIIYLIETNKIEYLIITNLYT